MEDKSLKQIIEESIKVSLKKGEKEKTITLRMAINEIQAAEKIKQTILDDPEISLIIQRMIKQRKDAMSQFQSAKRDELARKEGREIEILFGFLPTQLSVEEIQSVVSQTIKDLNAQSLQDIGEVMALLKKSLRGKADMSLVSSLVKLTLTK
tara:strand:- start:992 stop:1447 length:456 start_codon:yes stop_codon:yes gene_type:complete